MEVRRPIFVDEWGRGRDSASLAASRAYLRAAVSPERAMPARNNSPPSCNNKQEKHLGNIPRPEGGIWCAATVEGSSKVTRGPTNFWR